MKVYIFLFFFLFNNFANASIISKIINNFDSIESMKFSFVQNINGKIEKGECVVSYPKRIFCKYIGFYNKILVSNGKSLVINSDKNKQYYRYPLDKTPLDLILDKKFLLNKLDQVETIEENNETFSFKITHNNNLLNIFFDKTSYEIKGWTTTDIYLNKVETKLSNVETNIMIDERIFRVQNYIN